MGVLPVIKTTIALMQSWVGLEPHFSHVKLAARESDPLVAARGGQLAPSLSQRTLLWWPGLIPARGSSALIDRAIMYRHVLSTLHHNVVAGVSTGSLKASR